MRPLDGNAVLELNPSLVFPMLNVLLGGSGEPATTETRELTEIESSIIEGVVKIVLHDLKEAWAPCHRDRLFDRRYGNSTADDADPFSKRGGGGDRL